MVEERKGKMEAEIENLIPHRYPFLFVDKIIIADEKEIVGIKSFNKIDDIIVTENFSSMDVIPGMIIVESMAQYGGAGLKLAGLADGFFGLMSLENVTFFKEVVYKEEIKYVIKNLRISKKLIKQSGIAYMKGEPVTEATWICARFAE